MAVLDFETEVKTSTPYKVATTGLRIMSKIGAGALAGAACALIPTDKMSPFKRFCVGAGAYGIAQWVGRSAADAAEKDFEDTTQVITEAINAVSQLDTVLKKDEATETEETVAEETVEDPEVIVD